MNKIYFNLALMLIMSAPFAFLDKQIGMNIKQVSVSMGFAFIYGALLTLSANSKEKKAMSKFVIFWLDGTKTESEGINEKDAFIKSGSGGGATNAVDFICPKEDSSDYSWNSKTKSWEQTSIS